MDASSDGSGEIGDIQYRSHCKGAELSGSNDREEWHQSKGIGVLGVAISNNTWRRLVAMFELGILDWLEGDGMLLS